LRVVRKQREAVGETLLDANERAVIRRFSDRRVDQRDVAELRKRAQRLRIAGADRRGRYLVDREVVRGQMAADISDVAHLDDQAARQLVLQVEIHLIRRWRDLMRIKV